MHYVKKKKKEGSHKQVKVLLHPTQSDSRPRPVVLSVVHTLGSSQVLSGGQQGQNCFTVN